MSISIEKLPADAQLQYGFVISPFGECILAFSEYGLSALLYHLNRKSALADLQKRFSKHSLLENEEEAQRVGAAFFSGEGDIVLSVEGTDFQRSVWHALCEIPLGQTSTYAAIARKINRPLAVRATGTAIGANPIAWFIPCHRVLRTDGGIGGYRWGVDLKMKMLEFEKTII